MNFTKYAVGIYIKTNWSKILVIKFLNKQYFLTKEVSKFNNLQLIRNEKDKLRDIKINKKYKKSFINSLLAFYGRNDIIIELEQRMINLMII